MKKRVIEVDLLERLIVWQGQREDKPNGGGFYNGTEGLSIIATQVLIEPFSDKTCLKPIYCTI